MGSDRNFYKIKKLLAPQIMLVPYHMPPAPH